MTNAEIISMVYKYHKKSVRRLHLIPSENTMSFATRFPFITDMIHRYCFTSNGENWAWPGNSDIATIERLTADGLCELFGAKHINLKPISGLNCMAVAISALTDRGGTIFSISNNDGGHNSTQFLAQRLGLTCVTLPYNATHYSIDTDQLATLISNTHGPKLVYLDQFMCLFPHNLESIREAVGADTIIHYDGSHVLGLIAGGQFQKPLNEGADSLSGSTHKSFPGPHKGIFLTNSDNIAKKVDEHASYWVSQHHPADVASLAITVANLRINGVDYATRTINNAQRLAKALSNLGFMVCAEDKGFTRSHQLWIDITPIIAPFEASRKLLEAGIVVNAIEIPSLNNDIGLRLGVQELSWLGMGYDEMDRLALLFKRLLIELVNPQNIATEVQDILNDYVSKEDNQMVEMIMHLITQSNKLLL